MIEKWNSKIGIEEMGIDGVSSYQQFAVSVFAAITDIVQFHDEKDSGLLGSELNKRQILQIRNAQISGRVLFEEVAEFLALHRHSFLFGEDLIDFIGEIERILHQTNRLRVVLLR